MKLQYRYANNKAVQAKIAAWIELFGVEAAPSVRLSGTWKDADGEAVFFDTMRSDPVISIGRKTITVNVDGQPEQLTGTADSTYTLE